LKKEIKMSKSFKELKSTVLSACSEFITDGSKNPGIYLEDGGRFDGKDRVLVGSNWGKNLLNGPKLETFLKRIKAKIDPSLHCDLVNMRGAGAWTLVVQDRT
jgi:hypothetical protein